jgi:hypothetical protein
MGGHKVPMHLPTLCRHELTRLAQTGQLEGLLDGISTNQAFVKFDMLPGRGGGMPKQGGLEQSGVLHMSQKGTLTSAPT